MVPSAAGCTFRLIPFGSQRIVTPSLFSLLPRCHSECALEKNPGAPISRSSSAWSVEFFTLIPGDRFDDRADAAEAPRWPLPSGSD